MIPLLKDNYFRHHGSGDNFSITFDPITTPFGNYFEESKIAAEEVYALKTGNLHLMYSGGMDSEYVINVFLSLGMKVTPVIMRLQPGYNDHDTHYAMKFCQNNKLDYHLINLNYDKFVETQMLDIMERNRVGRYEIAASMWLAKQVDGTVITGNDPPLLLQRYKEAPRGIFLEELEYIHSQFNCWKNDGIYGTPFFLSYTPEMMLAILKEPTFVEFAQKQHPYKSTDYVKVGVFNNQTKFKLEPKPNHAPRLNNSGLFELVLLIPVLVEPVWPVIAEISEVRLKLTFIP